MNAPTAALEALQQAADSLTPPKNITALRAEYWKAGARAAINAMNEALAALPASGWRLVPVEPTTGMVDAGAAHIQRATETDGSEDEHYRAKGCAVAAWIDMLAAAPTPGETK